MLLLLYSYTLYIVLTCVRFGRLRLGRRGRRRRRSSSSSSFLIITRTSLMEVSANFLFQASQLKLCYGFTVFFFCVSSGIRARGAEPPPRIGTDPRPCGHDTLLCHALGRFPFFLFSCALRARAYAHTFNT